MIEAKQAVGTPMSRVDGRLKVTGGARYAAEFQVKDVAYGVLVLSAVAKGQVTTIDSAAVKVEETYLHPDEYHNPMELHATVAVWDGNKLTLYDKTQWVDNVQQQVAAAFGIDKDDVRVVSPFVGGAFGSALRAWVHVFIAALAAKHVRRPVKLVLTRAQQYTVPGYRPHTVQKVSLGATKDGQLTAIRHEATGQTSTFEEYTESTLNPTRFLYACPNVATRYRLAAMNVNTPASMRAPGDAAGGYAREGGAAGLAGRP